MATERTPVADRIVLEVTDAGAAFICPLCQRGYHGNHQRPGQDQPRYGPTVLVGACRSLANDTEVCVCEAPPPNTMTGVTP